MSPIMPRSPQHYGYPGESDGIHSLVSVSHVSNYVKYTLNKAEVFELSSVWAVGMIQLKLSPLTEQFNILWGMQICFPAER